MAFLHSVIGDNTIENREHLEKIGYKAWIVTDRKCLYTTTDSEEPWFSDAHITSIECIRNYINCIGNPQLFKAVSAITDDNDEDQWFTDGKEYIFCDRQDWIDMYSVLCYGGRYNYNKNGELDKFHKATLSELQAHFKRV